MNSHLDLDCWSRSTAGILDVPDVQVAAALTRVGGRTHRPGRCRGGPRGRAVRASPASRFGVRGSARRPADVGTDDGNRCRCRGPTRTPWISSAADHLLWPTGLTPRSTGRCDWSATCCTCSATGSTSNRSARRSSNAARCHRSMPKSFGHELRRLFPAPVPIGSVWRRRPPRCVGSRSSPVGPALGRRRQWPGSWLCCAAWHLRLSPWQHHRQSRRTAAGSRGHCAAGHGSG